MSEAISRGNAPNPGRSLSVESVLTGSGLPADVNEMIRRVVRNTRLWKRERIDVATELVAHFTDAVASGANVNEVVKAFGDEQTAAKLIRRAKLRNRGLAWQAWCVARAAGIALVLVYAGLAVLFFTRRPNVAVDYVAKLNEAIQPANPDDRAWPIYRQAIIDMKLHLAPPVGEGQLPPFDVSRTDAKWPEVVAWLDQHAAAIQAMHAARGRSKFGFVMGYAGDVNDDVLWPGMGTRALGVDNEGVQIVVSVLLPHLNHVRELAQIQIADARLAASRGHAARVVADVETALALGEQIGDEAILVSGFVDVGCRELTLRFVFELLATDPALLSDQQWQAIAHRLAGPRVAGDMITYDAERLMFYDVVQRVYSDDGNGDGRITHAGMRAYKQLVWQSANDAGQEPVVMSVAGPAVMVTVAGRSELVSTYNRVLDRAQANLRLPLRQVSGETVSDEVQAIRGLMLDGIRFAPIVTLVQSLERTQEGAERFLARRDGLLVAIACELFKRNRGSYPQRLDELVPTFLPRVPEDRIDGNPLRYKLVDGRPVIYSVGGNRTDDGGVAPTNGKPGRWHFASGSETDPVLNGDWIFWPPEPQE